MDSWQVVKTPPLPGVINMQVDLEAFKGFERGEIPSTIRIYSWQKSCISLGYSQKIEEEIDVERAREMGWDVVNRPTGGGIVFHNEAEVTYSLVTSIDNPILPKGLVPSYKKISEAVVQGLNNIGVPAEIQSSPRPLTRFARSGHPSPSSMERGMNFPPQAEKKGVRSLCFSYPAEYEIVVGGPSTPSMELGTGSLGASKKIVGSAQKRARKALLQQGSIFVQNTPAAVFSVIRKSYDELNAVSVEDILERKIGFEELSEALIEGFREGLGIVF